MSAMTTASFSAATLGPPPAAAAASAAVGAAGPSPKNGSPASPRPQPPRFPALAASCAAWRERESDDERGV